MQVRSGISWLQWLLFDLQYFTVWTTPILKSFATNLSDCYWLEFCLDSILWKLELLATASWRQQEHVMYFSLWGHRILCTPATQVTQFRSVSTLLHTKMGKTAFPSVLTFGGRQRQLRELKPRLFVARKINASIAHMFLVSTSNIEFMISLLVVSILWSPPLPNIQYSRPTLWVAWVLIEYHDVLQNDSQWYY